MALQNVVPFGILSRMRAFWKLSCTLFLCLLLAAYHWIMSGASLSEMIPAGYTKEGLKLAGFPVEED